MRWAVILFLVLIVALNSASADIIPKSRTTSVGKSVTPAEVFALIKTEGAARAVVLLDKSGAWALSVIPGIESAQPDWLEVARALNSKTDAGGSEELDDALDGALLGAPYVVLPMAKELWWSGSDTLCRYPWDSDPPGGVESYVLNLRKALEKEPPSEQLRSLRAECLRVIDATLKEVEKHKDDG